MKTLLYPAYERMEIAEAPDPQPGEGELLLKVSACGICGSELEAFRNRSPRRVPHWFWVMSSAVKWWTPDAAFPISRLASVWFRIH